MSIQAAGGAQVKLWVSYTSTPARVVIRPSGTEPKLKAYLETVVPGTGNLRAAQAEADGHLRALREAVISTLGL